jgi:glycosyltransferase involved in cell wall biosynthesis
MTQPEHPRRLVLVITEDWYYWSHRRPIARAARDAGYEVFLASRFTDHRPLIELEGIHTVPLKLRRSGRNPFGELLAIGDLVRVYRSIRPSVVHHVAIKPMLYGSWAARLSRVPGVVNAVSGLGYAFTGRTRKARLIGAAARVAYKTALRRRNTWTIFQNEDDRAHFVELGLLSDRQAVLIRGSGVDLAQFTSVPEPAGDPVILYAGRMLWSKGVGDLVEAARMLRADGRTLRVVLAGHSDADNPEAIPDEQLLEWTRDGTVEWLGRVDNVSSLMAGANVVVLGSEREGIPKVLIEAAASARAIVASDVPGCRDVVVDGLNGLLVPVHDPSAMKAAIGRLLDSPDERRRMGEESRRRAEQLFSEQSVVQQTLDLYQTTVENGRRVDD